MMEDEMPSPISLRSNTPLRKFIRRSPRLRETIYLLSELLALLRYRPGAIRTENARDYERRSDPWGYSTPWGTEHLQIISEILDRAVPSCFRRALDIGCGEGWITEAVASRCDSVLGVDIVPIALDRAKERCRSFPHVQFADWDLQRDPSLGTFDLIVFTGVMECFRSASEFRNARAKVLGMLAPGSQLLVTTTHQSDVFDRAWWCRWLPRGGRKIEEYLARGPYLEITDTVLSKTHRFTLFRRTPEPIHEASAPCE